MTRARSFFHPEMNVFQVTSVLGPGLIQIPKFVHCQVVSE